MSEINGLIIAVDLNHISPELGAAIEALAEKLNDWKDGDRDA